MINIAIVEDQKILAQTLTHCLGCTEEFNVVATYINGSNFLENYKNENIDVAILDVDLPDIDGITLCSILKQSNPEIKVIGFTFHESKLYFDDMVNNGAIGFVLKNDGLEELKNAIFAANDNLSYYSQGIFALILASSENKKSIKQNDVELSKRQLEIAELISKGLTTKEIATQIGISESTISTHRNHILKKLNVHNIAGITSYINNLKSLLKK